MDPAFERLVSIANKAQPEKLQGRSRWEIFRRRLLRDNTDICRTYAVDGWRLVVHKRKNTVITVERVKPHENFHAVPALKVRDGCSCRLN